jgi:magnesium transporter
MENETISLDKVEKGAWINLVNPTEDEIATISESLKIPLEHLKAALDEEERARIEVDKECTVVLIDRYPCCKQRYIQKWNILYNPTWSYN